MALILNKNIVFIDSMQFMDSSLEKLVKNLLDDDFKYLTLKHKGVYLYEYLDSFKRFSEEKFPVQW